MRIFRRSSYTTFLWVSFVTVYVRSTLNHIHFKSAHLHVSPICFKFPHLLHLYWKPETSSKCFRSSLFVGSTLCLFQICTFSVSWFACVKERPLTLFKFSQHKVFPICFKFHPFAWSIPESLRFPLVSSFLLLLLSASLACLSASYSCFKIPFPFASYPSVSSFQLVFHAPHSVSFPLYFTSDFNNSFPIFIKSLLFLPRFL